MHDAGTTRITVTAAGDEIRVACAGELDFLSRPLLAETLDVVVDQGPSCWIDLGDVTFLDSSTIHELVRVHHRALDRGVGMLIAPARAAPVMRPFELLGLMDRLPFARGRPRHV